MVSFVLKLWWIGIKVTSWMVIVVKILRSLKGIYLKASQTHDTIPFMLPGAPLTFTKLPLSEGWSKWIQPIKSNLSYSEKRRLGRVDENREFSFSSSPHAASRRTLQVSRVAQTAGTFRCPCIQSANQ
jgi:hypothetical protein